MNWPKKLIVVRHGHSAYNQLQHDRENDKLYRRFVAAFESDRDSEETKSLAEEVMRKFPFHFETDQEIPLSDQGRAQAHYTGRALAEEAGPIDRVFVSPLVRTMETLQIMRQEWPAIQQINPEVDDRLIEQRHGDADKYKDWRIFLALNPEEAERKAQNEHKYRYPNGESVEDMFGRVRDFLQYIMKEGDGHNILAVLSQLPISAMISMMEGTGYISYDRLNRNDKPLNCSVTTFALNGKAIPEMESYNCIYYPQEQV